MLWRCQVPPGLTAVMSASESSQGQVANLSGQKDNFFFRLKQPIPSYLLALAVGDIASAPIGPRSRVWAEPCMLVSPACRFLTFRAGGWGVSSQIGRRRRGGCSRIGPHTWVCGPSPVCWSVLPAAS